MDFKEKTKSGPLKDYPIHTQGKGVFEVLKEEEIEVVYVELSG